MQNLNSDDLRRQLDENNESMNALTDDNQRIVELLAQRGLKAIRREFDRSSTAAVQEETINAVISLVKDAASTPLNSEFNSCLSKIRKLLTAAHRKQGSE